MPEGHPMYKYHGKKKLFKVLLALALGLLLYNQLLLKQQLYNKGQYLDEVGDRVDRLEDQVEVLEAK